MRRWLGGPGGCAVTLAAALTLTRALLALAGRHAFWQWLQMTPLVLHRPGR